MKAMHKGRMVNKVDHIKLPQAMYNLDVVEIIKLHKGRYERKAMHKVRMVNFVDHIKLHKERKAMYNLDIVEIIKLPQAMYMVNKVDHIKLTQISYIHQI